MTIELLTGTERLVLLGAAFALAGIVVALRLRNGKPGAIAACTVAAVMCLGVLGVEQLVGFVVEVAAPSESDFNEYRWVMLAPWGRLGMAVGVVAVAAITVLAWHASRRLASPWRRAAMIGLRGAAALTALVLFLEPAIELRQVAREPNRVAILVDDSASMALREDADGPSRAERARALIEASASTLDGWEDRHHIDVFSFSETLVASNRAAVATNEPAGRATLVRQALEHTRARYDGRDLAGIVVVSDGVATGGLEDGAEDGASRDFLRSLETRVHTAWVGRSGLKDVAVSRVYADEFAFVRTVVRVEAVIQSTGFEKRRIPVTLSSDGKPLRQKWVRIGPDQSEATVAFEFTPPHVGKFVYEIATPVEDDEAVATNNKRSFVLRVIRDKIRVLQVAGQPSWDVRALRSMLKQNPNVDLISFFILRTHDDINSVPNDEMSLIPFPTRELFQQELPSFDLIVLQNFEYQPYGIGTYLENIRSYVEGGGGLAMLGGSLSFSSGAYAGTPVAEALPITLIDERKPSRGSRRWGNAGTYRPSDLLNTQQFTPVLTKVGQLHPITSLRYEVNDNLAAWKNLPELEGVNIIGKPKKGATVLAVHPKLKLKNRKPMPVMVAGEYGDGRSLAVTTDSLWRWGFVAAAEPGDDGRNYAKFWENAMRWLIQDPDLRYLHVDSDNVEYEPGAPVRLDVRLLERDYTPLPEGAVSIEVVRGSDPGDTQEVASTELITGESGEASYDLNGLEPGVYRVTARAEVSGRDVEATDIFLVREGAAELDRPAASEDLLRAVADATGGQYLGTAAELPSSLELDEPRVIRVDRRADVELWNRPALLFFALLFLGLEWLLRQRSGYL